MAIQNPVAPEAVVSRPPLPVRSTTTDENQYLLDVEAVEAATPAYNASLNDVAQNAYDNAGVTFNNATESANSAASASASSASASGFATAASNSASESLGYANQAASSANNLGAWANLSGSYNPPVAVEHNDSTWQLLEPVTLIENAEPGVSAKWSLINAGVATGGIVLSSQSASINGFLKLDGSTILKTSYPKFSDWADTNKAQEFYLVSSTLYSPDPTAQDFYGVIYANSLYVAAGGGGVIFTSPDNVTWTARTSGTANALRGLAHNGSQFVVVGNSGTILTSPDAITWTTQTSGTANLLYSVAWNGSQFVAVGASGTILTSPDAVTWTAQTSGTASTLQGILWDGSQFVVVGASGTILTSPDAVTWTVQTSNTTQPLRDIELIDGRYVAAGNGAVYSDDTVTWTESIAWGSAYVYSLTEMDGIFLSCGGAGKILTTVDGVNWIERESNTSQTLYAAATTPAGAMSVGASGTITTQELDNTVLVLTPTTDTTYAGFVSVI